MERECCLFPSEMRTCAETALCIMEVYVLRLSVEYVKRDGSNVQIVLMSQATGTVSVDNLSAFDVTAAKRAKL